MSGHRIVTLGISSARWCSRPTQNCFRYISFSNIDKSFELCMGQATQKPQILMKNFLVYKGRVLRTVIARKQQLSKCYCTQYAVRIDRQIILSDGHMHVSSAI